MEETKVVRSIRVSPSLWTKLRLRAIQEGKPVQEVVEDMIEMWLKQKEVEDAFIQYKKGKGEK